MIDSAVCGCVGDGGGLGEVLTRASDAVLVALLVRPPSVVDTLLGVHSGTIPSKFPLAHLTIVRNFRPRLEGLLHLGR